MVWFSCDACGDTIKKPKLNGHRCGGGGATFTCVDCSMTFDRMGANGHTRCVTEHEKYALGATKPGGFAAGGFSGGGDGNGNGNGTNSAAAAGEPSGLEFLSERPPWRCSACNVNCTSRETLLGHAAGQKHRRRARAAAAAAAGGGGGGGDKKAEEQQQAAAPPTPGKAADEQQEQVKEKKTKQEQKKQQADSSSSSDDSSDSSDSDSDAEKEKKKKRKRDDGDETTVDKAVLAKVLLDARKKLAAKGKLKLDKLRAIVAKQLKKGGKGGDKAAVEAAAVAELQRGAEGSKRAKLSKDGAKLKVASS